MGMGTIIRQETGQSRPLRIYLLQAAGWLLLITALWTLDTLTRIEYLERAAVFYSSFRLYTEQVTSAVGVFVMVGFVAWWLDHFPLRTDRLLTTLVSQLLGSILFATGHYTILYGLRRLVYALADLDAGVPISHLSNLVFEYQQDIKIYLGIVIIMLLYGIYVGRRSGTGNEPSTGTAADKLLVQTGSGEAILNHDQIDYLESARNYVSVFANGREYLTRNTMKNLLDQLPVDKFIRTHRSYAVNLDKVAEIRSQDSAWIVRTTDDREIPLSRQYRDALRQRIAGRESSAKPAS